jgi:hypothetical protein
MADSDEESFHSASEGLEEEDFDTIKDEKNIPKVETSKAKYSEEKEIVCVDKNDKVLKPSDNTKVEAKQENQPTKQIDQNEIREKSNIEDDVPIKKDDVPINKKEEKIPSNEGWDDTFEDEDQKSSPEVTENDWDDDWKVEFEPTTSLDTIEKEKARQDLPKEKARQELPKEKKFTTTDDDWFAKQLTESSKSPPKQSSIWDWSGFNDVVTAVGMLKILLSAVTVKPRYNDTPGKGSLYRIQGGDISSFHTVHLRLRPECRSPTVLPE